MGDSQGDRIELKRMSERRDDILAKLSAVRRRVRWLLAVDGAALLLAIGLPSSVAFALIDWWVDFPGLIRMLALAVGGGWAAAWAWVRMVRPLTAPIPLEQLALRLRAMNSEERDDLASAVEFLDGHGSGSPEIWERAIAATRESAGDRAWKRGLDPRRAVRSAATAVALIGLLIMLDRWSPELSDVGRARLLSPWSTVEWPRRVRIVAQTGDMTAAYGEAVTTAMRVERGDEPYLRAFVEWGQPGGERRRQLMQRESDGTFRFTIENVRAPVEYFFVAGDDDTRKRPFRIGVARRPEAERAELTIEPPAYAAKDFAPQTHALTGETLVGVRGSRARLDVFVRRGETGSAEVQAGEMRFLGGESVSLAPDSARPGVLSAWFDVKEGGTFQIRLVDSGGLESRGEQSHELAVREDEPPRIEIVEPSGDLEMTPRGILAIRVVGRDDFGLGELRLLAGVDDSELTPAVDLMRGELDGHGEATDAGMGPTVDRRMTWRLSSIEPPVAPGSVVEMVAEGRDTFDLDGRRHEAVRSASRRVRFVAESEFAESLRQSLTASGSRLRRLAAELRATRTETGRLDEKPAVRQAMSAADRESAARLALELRQIAKAGGDAAEQLSELWERAEQNQATRLDVAGQARRVERILRELTREAMREARTGLSKASESGEHDQQHEALTESMAAQDRALEELGRMLDALDRWNEFADMARLVRDLLDRQEELSRQCGRMAGEFGGKGVDELTDAERGRLRDVQSGQSRLQSETSAVIRSMFDLAGSAGKGDSASAATLERAARKAGELKVVEHMGSAVVEIERARLRRGRESQTAAIAGLRAVLADLDERPDRELAALARELSDLIASLEKLVRAQEELIELTRSTLGQSTSSSQTARLADRQRALSANAEGIAKRVGAEPSGAGAVFSLMTAMAHMTTAAGSLERGDPAPAMEDQESARVQLIEAMESLREMQEQSEKEMAERSLAGILDALSELRATQAAIRRETSGVADRVSQGGRPGRGDRVKLNSLAKRQGELADPLGAVVEKMKGSVVYRRVCERIGERMESARKRLTALEPADALADQSEVLSQLDRLIEVLETRPSRKNDRFVETGEGGGGGGAGDPSMSRPVPALAELKVLRMMQEDLNARTRQLGEQLPEALSRTEAQLRDIERLGEDQREIHELCETMVRQQGGSEP